MVRFVHHLNATDLLDDTEKSIFGPNLMIDEKIIIFLICITLFMFFLICFIFCCLRYVDNTNTNNTNHDDSSNQISGRTIHPVLPTGASRLSNDDYCRRCNNQPSDHQKKVNNNQQKRKETSI